jgi:hypothetical protein
MTPAESAVSASSDSHYPQNPVPQALVLREQGIEEGFIEKLRSLKYTYRPDIRDRTELERNFRTKFEALNRVHLTCLARRSRVVVSRCARVRLRPMPIP